MNKERLLKLADIIENDTVLRFDMNDWIRNDLQVKDSSIAVKMAVKNECGTTCCIAGYAAVELAKMGKELPLHPHPVSRVNFLQALKEYVEVKPGDNSVCFLDLINADYWPDDLADKYELAESEIERRKLAAEAIRRVANSIAVSGLLVPIARLEVAALVGSYALENKRRQLPFDYVGELFTLEDGRKIYRELRGRRYGYVISESPAVAS